jgi:uncharacterized protein involved in exopolysaccharide biosynthesis
MYELENDDEIEIDLRELFLALKKKIVWILLTAIVFAGASGLDTASPEESASVLPEALTRFVDIL